MLFSKPGVDFLIVGLGNPGRAYEKTRHNVGFRSIDLLGEKLGARLNRAKFSGLTGEASYHGMRLLLLKPQTFMNLSGQAVREAARFYKIEPSHIIVLFDDISLPPGRLRVRGSGSAGGHNGVKSIISQLGSQDFPRVKLGVGAKPHPDYDLADWVMSTFSAQEEKALASAMERGAEAVLTICEKGVPEAMNRFNGSV